MPEQSNQKLSHIIDNKVTVIVTRSGDAGKQLVESLDELNLQSFYLPTLGIKKLDYLLAAEDYEQAIFLSTNAVKYSLEQSLYLKEMLPQTVIAVGQATAKRLVRNDIHNVLIPKSSNSEGLLELSSLKNVEGQQILIIKGRGGRQLLQKSLSALGAICHEVEVYSREKNRLDRSIFQAFIKANAKVSYICFASVDGMMAFIEQIDDQQILTRLIAIVASSRIADKAKHYAFKAVVIADSACNDAMIKAILFAQSKTP